MLILRFSSKVDIMTFFITKNNSIPFMKTKKCVTGADNLDSVDIMVYEGERASHVTTICLVPHMLLAANLLNSML
jgi:molecular chaperone DnaK (HSP70)